MKKIICISIFIFLTSCSGVDFVYKDKKNITNPLYEKTNIDISGTELVFITTYLPMLFGDNKFNEFNLFIDIKEKKTKTSVEKNQVASNLMYELRLSQVKVYHFKCIIIELNIGLLLRELQK